MNTSPAVCDASRLCAEMVLRSLRTRSEPARKGYAAAAQFFALAVEQLERNNKRTEKGTRR